GEKKDDHDHSGHDHSGHDHSKPDAGKPKPEPETPPKKKPEEGKKTPEKGKDEKTPEAGKENQSDDDKLLPDPNDQFKGDEGEIKKGGVDLEDKSNNDEPDREEPEDIKSDTTHSTLYFRKENKIFLLKKEGEDIIYHLRMKFSNPDNVKGLKLRMKALQHFNNSTQDAIQRKIEIISEEAFVHDDGSVDFRFVRNRANPGEGIQLLSEYDHIEVKVVDGPEDLKTKFSSVYKLYEGANSFSTPSETRTQFDVFDPKKTATELTENDKLTISFAPNSIRKMAFQSANNSGRPAFLNTQFFLYKDGKPIQNLNKGYRVTLKLRQIPVGNDTRRYTRESQIDRKIYADSQISGYLHADGGALVKFYWSSKYSSYIAKDRDYDVVGFVIYKAKKDNSDFEKLQEVNLEDQHIRLSGREQGNIETNDNFYLADREDGGALAPTILGPLEGISQEAIDRYKARLKKEKQAREEEERRREEREKLE
ncbi:hypothetical protein, partial [Ureaplasma canigenitalium]|uniref:hypothetical protein n=1 Tax=Ureaplasma canigenitalium TaxID=42092 RepID=UPI000570C2DA